MTFRCPARRLKGLTMGVCNGFLAGYDLAERHKTNLLLYCGKCGRFFMAEPVEPDGFYRLRHVDKHRINFVPAPFTYED